MAKGADLLQTMLQELMNELTGSHHVYFQPPENKKLLYPAIVFKRDNRKNNFADNNVYKQANVYRLTVIDYDPDSELFSIVSKLPTAKFVTAYAAEGLNHEIYTIYFK